MDEFSQVEGISEYEFAAILRNPKMLLNVLQSIDLQDKALVMINDRGIRFTIDKARSFQVSSFLQKDLFDVYELKPHEEDISFEISIRQIIHTLSAMIESSDKESSLQQHANNEQQRKQKQQRTEGDNNGGDVIVQNNGNLVKLMYKEYGHPLLVVFQYDFDTITICREMTSEASNIPFLQPPGRASVGKIILMAEFLKDVFSELDFGSTNFQLTFDEEQGIKIMTCSMYAKMAVQIRKSSDQITQFTCQGVHSNAYPMSVIKCSLKALGQSSKASVKMGEEGLLSMQFMIVSQDNHRCFVEYVCMANVDPNI